MKFIPLAVIKSTAKMIAFCKNANEAVVANRNGDPKIVFMSRQVYEAQMGAVTEDGVKNLRRDVELVAPPIMIRVFKNPADAVRICETFSGQVIPVLRNGIDELYMMDYRSYAQRMQEFRKFLNGES